MRHAYRQPIRKPHEPPVDGEWLMSWIAAVIDLPGFVYWRVRMKLGANKMTDTTSGAFHSVPTFAQRFWRALGFRYHHNDDPPGADLLPGWMCTDMGLNFSFADRVRILVTGRLRISSYAHFDSPSPKVCKTRMDWHILPPGKY